MLRGLDYAFCQHILIMFGKKNVDDSKFHASQQYYNWDELLTRSFFLVCSTPLSLLSHINQLHVDVYVKNA